LPTSRLFRLPGMVLLSRLKLNPVASRLDLPPLPLSAADQIPNRKFRTSPRTLVPVVQLQASLPFVRWTFLQVALDALSKAEASRNACRNTRIDRQNANGVMPRTTLPKHLETRTSSQKAQGRPKQFRFSISYFLGALILNILISPFTDPLRSGDLIETMLMTSVLLVAVLSIAGRWRALVGILLAAPAVIGEWLNHWDSRQKSGISASRRASWTSHVFFLRSSRPLTK